MAVEGVLDFRLVGNFRANQSVRISPGRYSARLDGERIGLFKGGSDMIMSDQSIRLLPESLRGCRSVLRGVPIGAGFHWEHERDLILQGELHLQSFDKEQVQVINRPPLETYLSSVIGSEMRGTASLEFLKAHAVISRSWAFRRMGRKSRPPPSGPPSVEPEDGGTILRWTGAEVHEHFDVCADDHCQRYRGILSERTSNPERAVEETRGEVLTHGNEICDTRYSKCCGGMTENFSTAWDDWDIPYLRALPDNRRPPPGFSLPLSEEANGRVWITGSPEAFCNTEDPELLEAVLPQSDRGTTDFFRWQTVFSQEEICKILAEKTGRHLGRIRALLPLERGASGRIVRLRIVGRDGTLTVGKELEIRRVLSSTHLYSSAFVIEGEPGRDGVPRSFRLTGAGWGHGVGLCQIGAAVMSARGKTYQEILGHYFPGTTLRTHYRSEGVR